MLIVCLIVGALAGLLGALVGLGGGIIVVPALETLTDWLGQPMKLPHIVALSQVGVLAVALGGSSRQLTAVDFELAYRLAPLTIGGGVVGSLLGMVLPTQIVASLFALLLFYSAAQLLYARPIRAPLRPSMIFAGIMSGLLGIGGGTVQVPVLRLIAGLEMRSAIATSTFMMGLTATINALIYASKGILEVQWAGALAIGMLLGGMAGAQLQKRVSSLALGRLLSGILIITGLELLWKHWLSGLFF